MLSSYYTVKKNEQHVLTVQKSRFLTSVSRADTEEQAIQFIEEKKKIHYDANHNCSAYMIGMHDEVQKANDDGEPTGTAGVPILEVIKKNNLKNTVIVVTRYFGGIKLGAGGLIRAYGSAASEGIKASGIVKCERTKIMHIKVGYTWIGKLENELRSGTVTIKDIHYAEDVAFEVYVSVEQIDSFEEWITNMTNGQAIIEEGETVFLEKDL